MNDSRVQDAVATVLFNADDPEDAAFSALVAVASYIMRARQFDAGDFEELAARAFDTAEAEAAE